MKATDLLDELRPPLDTTPDDGPTLERILRAGPAPAPSRAVRYRRPLVAVGAAAILATGAVALAPSTDVGPVGLARAVADLGRPGVLLHFTATTTYDGRGRTSVETWQTPDGRLSHEIGDRGIETSYDQAGGTLETYVRSRDEVLVTTRDAAPGTFADRPDPFGTVASGSRSQVGDLPALLRRALDGRDPDVRHLGRTTVRGVDVDHVEVRRRERVAAGPRAGAGRPPGGSTTAAGAGRRGLVAADGADARTITVVRDVYVRHDDALPVRVVQRPGYDPGSVTDFDDVRRLELDAATRPLLRLTNHPGAKRTVQRPFDDRAAAGGAGD